MQASDFPALRSIPPGEPFYASRAADFLLRISRLKFRHVITITSMEKANVTRSAAGIEYNTPSNSQKRGSSRVRPTSQHPAFSPSFPPGLMLTKAQ